MSEYPTLDVMTGNNPTRQSPFFELPPVVSGPRPKALAFTFDRIQFEALDLDGMTAELTAVLSRLKNRSPNELIAGGVAPDGTIAIKSLIAVCLIGSIGKAFGT